MPALTLAARAVTSFDVRTCSDFDVCSDLFPCSETAALAGRTPGSQTLSTRGSGSLTLTPR